MSPDKKLDKAYWDERWKNDSTAWDMGMVSPPLKAYIDQLNSKDLKILIPGCGNAYEAEYLIDQGFTDITLIDYSAPVVERFKLRYGNNLPSGLKVLCTDFFEFDQKMDLIIEQTFFCAINPTLREKYVSKMHSMLNEGGKLVGLLFNTEFEKEGPPFGGAEEEYRHLFSDLFILKEISTAYNSHPKRANNELFINFIKK